MYGYGNVERYEDSASSRFPSASRQSPIAIGRRSEEHTSELQSPCNLVCRLLLEKKKKHIHRTVLLTATNFFFRYSLLLAACSLLLVLDRFNTLNSKLSFLAAPKR